MRMKTTAIVLTVFLIITSLLSGCAERRLDGADAQSKSGAAAYAQSEQAEAGESRTEKTESSSENPQEQSSESESTGGESGEEVERDWRLMLVNLANPLPEDFSPTLAMTPYGYEVDERITEDVKALIEGAKSDGVSLIICYGYRTLEQSRQLFEKQINKQLSYGLSQQEAEKEAMKWVSPPGTSDHHTGLALDIVTPEHQVLNHAFYNTPAGRWMAQNSWKYGFVVRFPEDKQDITGITYEPWHLRFVGKEHAQQMHQSGECLEEYVARLYEGE